VSEEPTAAAGPTGGGRGGATLSRPAILLSATVTAFVAFVVGFALAVGGGDGDGGESVTAAPTTETAEVPDATTSTRAAPTTSPPTTAAPTTTATSTPPTSPSTSPPVAAPPPPPPVTAAPAQLSLRYPSDASNRVVMNRGGTAVLSLTNIGGSISQWLVQTSGAVSVNGVASGTLAPGATVQVLLVADTDVPPVAPQGNLIVSGGAGGSVDVGVLIL
jgi:hypothetical protein